MVNKSQVREIQEEPPPLDESWWQAVLTDEEQQGTSSSTKDAFQAHSGDGRSDGQPEAGAKKTDWEKAARLYKEDETISLTVTGFNRGGLLVNGTDLQGFVPVSHLMDYGEDQSRLEEVLGGYIDRSLRLKVIECDRARGRVVFSERAAQSEPGSRVELLHNLMPDDCVTGKVTNITDFGVFVDLGGVEGLIHVSEISWGRVQHPADVVSLNQDIEVYVIQVDQERARVALSLKRLDPNPWQTVHLHYHTGQTTEAVITSIVPFGAFARLEDGLDGLIHISEMCAGGEVAHPHQLLKEGQKIKVRILLIDRNRQRLGLSMNLDDDSPADAAIE